MATTKRTPRKGKTTTKKPAAAKEPQQPQHQPAATLALEPGQIVPGPQFYADVKNLIDVLHAAKTFEYIPYEVAAAKLLKGVELGLHATQALKHIWITDKGDLVADSAELFRALIQRSGGSIVPIEMTAEQCVVRCTRGGITNDFSYTIQEAAAQGLTGHGGNWDTIRPDMLFARATTRAARAMFADVVSGLSYTAEEVGGAHPVPPAAPTQPAPAQAPTPSPAQAAPPQQSAPRKKEPSSGDALAGAEAIEGRQPTILAQVQDANGVRSIPTCGITSQQLMAVKAILTKHPDVRPVYDGFMGAVQHKRITALTEQEGRTLITRLQAQPDAPAAAPETPPAAPPQDAGASTEEAEPAKGPVTWDAAKGALDALVQEMGLPQAEVEMILAASLDLSSGTLTEATPQQLQQARTELQRLVQYEAESLKVAIANAGQILRREQPALPGGPY